MKILGLITARGGSKGIPGKNIKLLNGRPLIDYTISAAKESQSLSKTVLSSDDKRIIEFAQSAGIEVPFTRPVQLAKDDTPSIEVIKHALEFYKTSGEHYEAVCLLQPTTPFRRKGLIDEAILKFRDGNYDSLITVREIPSDFNPHWAFEEENGELKISTGEDVPIPRRQELPKAYHRDGAIYIARTNVIMQNSSLLGQHIGFLETSNDNYVNIDTPEDWVKAEAILKK